MSMLCDVCECYDMCISGVRGYSACQRTCQFRACIEDSANAPCSQLLVTVRSEGYTMTSDPYTIRSWVDYKRSVECLVNLDTADDTLEKFEYVAM